MTFREFMLENGYELQTTFWNDFSIADRFGLSAIQDTFNRAFKEWKENYKYLTDLVLVLNHKIWQYYETRPEIATLYNTLWAQASQYAMEHGPNKSRYWCSKQILVTQKVPVTDVFPPFTGTFYGFFLSFFHDFHTPCRHLESGAIFYGGVF